MPPARATPSEGLPLLLQRLAHSHDNQLQVTPEMSRVHVAMAASEVEKPLRGAKASACARLTQKGFFALGSHARSLSPRARSASVGAGAPLEVRALSVSLMGMLQLLPWRS